jgi:Protein of unknown function (DUF3987)/Bifunctional DNA primase/polymerase, N-terminal
MIGVPTGAASGIVALDVDIKNGHDGLLSLEALGGAPETLTIRTPSGGLHYVFKHNPSKPLGNSAGKLGDGLDVRGDGGYVVAAGSMDANGKAYERLNSLPLADAPEWIYPTPPNDKTDKTDFNLSSGSFGPSDWARAALAGEVGRVATAGAGTRNAALNQAAFSLGQIVGGGSLDESTVRDALTEAARSNGLLADDGEKSVADTITSGLESGKKKPRKEGDKGKATGSATESKGCPPEPLVRPLVDGTPYPLDCLPAILKEGVNGIVAKVQCPIGLAANSVLAAAALACQAHVNVPSLSGGSGPISLFAITVAKSGERKSSADALAMKPITDWERDRVKDSIDAAEAHRLALATHEASMKAATGRARQATTKEGDIKGAMRREIEALGEPPKPPIRPNLICDEPTVEGLWMLLSEGLGTAGIFSAEGGAFVGGHAMNADNRLKSAALFSQMWDGVPLRRVRVSGISDPLYERRVSVHLMGQPDAMAGFVSDPILRDQGLLARFLWCAPTSTMGTRMQATVSASAEAGLRQFQRAIRRCLELPIPRPDDDERACAPRLLELSPEARSVIMTFADDVECELAPDGHFSSITGLAAKLTEQALRIAGVFAFVSDQNATAIDETTMKNACALTLWHGGEALRLFNAGTASPEIAKAEALREWLLKQAELDVAQSAIQQRGPNRIRDKKDLDAALKILTEANWVTKVSERPAIWRVWRVAN